MCSVSSHRSYTAKSCGSSGKGIRRISQGIFIEFLFAKHEFFGCFCDDIFGGFVDVFPFPFWSLFRFQPLVFGGKVACFGSGAAALAAIIQRGVAIIDEDVYCAYSCVSQGGLFR